jgi:hypothetical protein
MKNRRDHGDLLVDGFRTGLVLNLGFDLQELGAPRLALTLRAFVYGVAHGEAVVAGPSFIALEFSALRTRIEGFGGGVAMLLVQHVFARDTHDFPPRPT